MNKGCELMDEQVNILAESEFCEDTFSKEEVTTQDLDDKVFELCTFVQCDFSQSVFRRCRFIDCAFKDCNLSMTQFRNAQLNGVTFDSCKCAGVKWNESNRLLFSVSFNECLLVYSMFHGMNLKKIKIIKSIAHEASFDDADLSDSDLSETDFLGAIFRNTNLQKADFRGAFNYSIDCLSNNVKKAKFALPEAVSLLKSFDIIVS